MRQMIIDDFDEELERRLRQIAQQEGLSLNEAALRTLRRGAGLRVPASEADVVGDSLDHLIGSWSAEEEKEFLEAIEVFEQIDEKLWS